MFTPKRLNIHSAKKHHDTTTNPGLAPTPPKKINPGSKTRLRGFLLIVEEIKLNNFRNLENYSLSLAEKKNLIYGPNGAGKTSILEAIFLMAFGKSFLNVKKSEIVKESAQELSANLTIRSKFGQSNLHCHYKNSFTVNLNGKKSSILEINNYLYPVFFSSSNYNLYIESKTHIRKLTDRFIFGLDSLYLNTILRYNKGLRQKNYLLKTKQNFGQLSSWNKLLSELSENLIRIKMKFVEDLNNQIAGKFGKHLRVSYTPAFQLQKDHSVNRESLFDQLEKIKQSEILYKRSLIGPHLDNFELYLEGKNLKFYSSGEKKIHLLMLYIAFIEQFKETKNDYPVFLVDDFDTAIDEKNIDFLMENYPEMQVIATSTAVKGTNEFNRLIELRKEK
ncbi:MAG: AAA family ATPase [bacterium]|nr:AAA family ATPase [bacterium]